MPLTKEEIAEIATRTADEVMERVSLEREERELRDHIIGGAMGEGAIPLYGRETRREPCAGCRIDPTKPLEAGNVMATTNDAIGTLSRDEVRRWCSEIIEVTDGRCARARAIRTAAKECKEKHPDDTEAFFRCYAPAFSTITKEGNPGTRVRFDRADIDSAIEAAKRLKSDSDQYVFATYLGYTIEKRPPPGMQQYVVVHPDGTTETIKPSVGVNPVPTGTCYEEAWRFLIKQEEGELVHGSVQTIGKRINHAWVELPTGYVWEPESGEFMKKSYFYERAEPIEEHRYSPEEAAIMVARVSKHGPWTDEERARWLK